jgi:hypothetical protein
VADPGRDLFERLKVEGWPLVDEWMANAEAETLHLEFKFKTNPESVAIDSADKANIAKTLSAFANTEGGLLVMGIDAGGGGRGGFDRVTNLVPVADAERFGGALERVVRIFTDPPIAGLMVHRTQRPGSEPAGIVAVYVPPSRGGPHRALNATAEVNDRYYMRTSSCAQTIPHSLLAVLFLPTPRAVLLLRRIPAGVPVRVMLGTPGTPSGGYHVDAHMGTVDEGDNAITFVDGLSSQTDGRGGRRHIPELVVALDQVTTAVKEPEGWLVSVRKYR